MDEKVKAVVMTAPGKVETQYLNFPDMEKGSIALKMHLSGICGTDKHAFKGQKTLYGGTEAEQEVAYPAVHGHENVGEIVEIEPENNLEYTGGKLEIGDRVTMCPNIICKNCWYCRHIFAYPFCPNNKTIGLSFRSDKPPYVVGGWANYMYVPPGTWIYKVRKDMPDELACMAEIFVVTANLDRAKEFSRLEARGFGFGDTVLIQGAGPVGLMHLAKAQILGADKTIVLDNSDKKLELAEEFHCDHTINISRMPHRDRVKKVKDLTNGRGADVIVESAGTAEAVREGLEYVRRGGTFIETGNFVDTGEININPHRHLAAKNVLLIGNTNHPHTQYYQAMDMMMKHSRRFPFEKMITHVYSLDEAEEAMKKSFEPDSIKVVFKPG